MGFLSPFRGARRRRALERHPIDDELWDWAIKEHKIFQRLNEADRVRLRELSTIFLAEKLFDPVGDVRIDEELKVSVAAQACLPLLGLDMDWYSDWSTIIVTPREYDVRKRDVDEAGVVHEYDDEFAGEAFELGPVALSRADVEASGWGDGYNVVIHEMAHKLDARNGDYDGAPPLRPGMSPAAWQAAFKAAYEDLRTRLEAPSSRKPRRGKLRKSGAPRIDAYAAEGPDEFFAVACEYFYERPELLRQEYPAVYEQLVLFFARDPAARGSVEA
jgi:Mlc titration factor MtfA (ptsG expression regulator)